MVKEEIKCVYFVLATRFPTEKAYGTTTEFSAQAVNKLGYKTAVITSFKDKDLDSEVEVVQVGTTLRNLLFPASGKYLASQRFGFFRILFAALVKSRFKATGNLFWTRDLLVAFILGFGGKRKVVCELHRTPKNFNLNILQRLSKMKNVAICPISSFLSERFPDDYRNTVIAGMAVRSEDLCDKESIGFRSNSIVYLGNSSSSGILLDYNFINEVAHKLFASHKDWAVKIIGTDGLEFEDLSRREVSPNIEILGRLNHFDAMRELEKASIGLVIYPDSDYFRDSFPIKIVEYASKGLAIVASDTTAHRRILTEELCIFYKFDLVDDLLQALTTLIGEERLRVSLSEKARVWAEQRTYTNRVAKVLDFVSGV